MTLRATGFHLICDRCTSVEELPARSESYAVKLRDLLHWRHEGEHDFCPQCEKLLEADGTLGPRHPDSATPKV